jgi:HCOMODA/2-hydroxy-3-carboxy-muconic semialdehyde decarboxylase
VTTLLIVLSCGGHGTKQEPPTMPNPNTTRRELVRLGACLAIAPLLALPRRGGAQADSSPERVELERLVAANRILAHENVVDAFGHVSIRDPQNPKRYVLARSRSPELIELADLMSFELDGTPLDPRGRTPYGERMIHGAIYEARPDVHSVVHFHSYAVLPFTISGVPLKPVVHTAGILGAEIPVWDIRDEFGDTDMLVRNMAEGRSLAKALGPRTCVLMRGHGAAVAAGNVKEAVLTAYYLQVDAQVELQALALGGAPKALSPAEIAATTATQFSPLGIDRAWEYFCIRAGVEPL